MPRGRKKADTTNVILNNENNNIETAAEITAPVEVKAEQPKKEVKSESLKVKQDENLNQPPQNRKLLQKQQLLPIQINQRKKRAESQKPKKLLRQKLPKLIKKRPATKRKLPLKGAESQAMQIKVLLLFPLLPILRQSPRKRKRGHIIKKPRHLRLLKPRTLLFRAAETSILCPI